MIFIKDGDDVIKYTLSDKAIEEFYEESPDQEWLDELGYFGTHTNFGEITLLPRTDTARMETKLSTYKACNVTCDYCLEKWYAEDYGMVKTMYPKHSETKAAILEYRPSAIEFTGGEIFQEKNMKAIQGFLDFLDDIDPEKHIKVEIISNGSNSQCATKIYSDPRTFISISFDPDEVNLRTLPGSSILDTIKNLAAIDPDRLMIFWMLSSHHDLKEARKKFDNISKLGVKWIPQPVNEVEGFFENDENFDLNFVKRMIEDVPEMLEKYKPRGLVFPMISCLSGMVKLFANNQVSCCAVGRPEDTYPDHDQVIKSVGKLTVAAGTNHVCSKFQQIGIQIPSNWGGVGRLAYTLIAHNFIEMAKEKNVSLQVLMNSYKDIYDYMIKFKYTITKKINKKTDSSKRVVVDVVYPHMPSIEKMTVVRLLEKIDIKTKTVIDNTGILLDNQWFSFEDGEDVTGYLLYDFLQNRKEIDDNDLIFLCNEYNFPRVFLAGRKKDVEELLLFQNSTVETYPKNYANVKEAIFSVKSSIDGSKI